jgi:arylsulfatase A-like enzyme
VRTTARKEYVDNRIGELLDTLRTGGQLDNTYIIFWADNSNHVGEHRAKTHVSGGKGLPHTIDSKMPLWVRGPAIAPGTVYSAPVAAVDIAPTIADMANAPTTRPVDGRSFLLLAEGAKANATAVDPTSNVQATFSEDMMASSINATTFKLMEQGSTTKIAATVSYRPSTDTATLDPTSSL